MPGGEVPRLTPQEVGAWRRAHRLSMKQMAERVGVTERYVAQWEQGVRVPWYLAAVLHYLDCRGGRSV